MARSINWYVGALLIFLCGWLWLDSPVLKVVVQETGWHYLLIAILFYLCSHIFRMLRLALLCLDRREKIFPLLAAHALTAFPSVFLPFKLGEALRLSSFFYAFEWRQKALAIWIVERFGDVAVIMFLIGFLYFSGVEISSSMRAVFMVFLVVSVLGILGLIAIAKVFVYVNRHLVLNSYSQHGLVILRMSHWLRRLELNIAETMDGRVSGFILLSVLIWLCELLALSVFVRKFSVNESDWLSLFSAGLLESLPGYATTASGFGVYQSCALVVITLLFLMFVLIARCARK